MREQYCQAIGEPNSRLRLNALIETRTETQEEERTGIEVKRDEAKASARVKA